MVFLCFDMGEVFFRYSCIFRGEGMLLGLGVVGVDGNYDSLC